MLIIRGHCFVSSYAGKPKPHQVIMVLVGLKRCSNILGKVPVFKSPGTLTFPNYCSFISVNC